MYKKSTYYTKNISVWRCSFFYYLILEVSMISDETEAYINSTHKEVLKKLEKALEETTRMFLQTAKTKFERCFLDSVTHFYASYTPIHPDSRHMEMYDLFEAHLDVSDGAGKLAIDFDPSKMSFENGSATEDGLYDQAFRKGWHGGAASGEFHPSPGTPYLRAPYDHDFTRRYHRWYRPASVAPIAPLDEFYKLAQEYWEGAEAQQDLDNAWSACAKRNALS